MTVSDDIVHNLDSGLKEIKKNLSWECDTIIHCVLVGWVRSHAECPKESQ